MAQPNVLAPGNWSTTRNPYVSIIPSNRTDATNCSPVTDEQWLASQLPPAVLCSFMITAQVLNLLVFRFWLLKEPYVLYHVSLALSSFLGGISIMLSVVLRYVPITPMNVDLTRTLVFAMYYFADCSAQIAICCVSLDRWVSLEFPIFYRTKMTRRVVLTVIFGPIWSAAFMIVAIGSVYYWTEMKILPCSHRKVIAPDDRGYPYWYVAKGPFVMPLLFLSQLRILTIASAWKLKAVRNRRAVNAAVTAGSGQCIVRALFRIVWSSLLASMAVVVGTLICAVPPLVFNIWEIPTSDMTARYFFYMSLVQHCYSPLIYVSLFPDYRHTLYGLCRRTRVWSWLRRFAGNYCWSNR